MTPTSTTFVLKAEPAVAEYLNNQTTTTDPSQLINQLLRRAKEQDNLGKEAGQNAIKAAQDDRTSALEDFLDADVPAAG